MSTLGYLVHDLTDPAVARRLTMLRIGGAHVQLAGFVREGRPVPQHGPEAPVILGHSRDARLAQRAAQVAWISLRRMAELTARFRACDAIMARNLEMLMVAARVATRVEAETGRRTRLVYECLDIHRLLTARSAVGHGLRAIERRLERKVDLVVTSSPAFVDNHLHRAFSGKTMLVENKVLRDPTAPPLASVPTPMGPPWRIGWFGALRCRRSLDALRTVAEASGGNVEIVIRGRPSSAVFPDFVADVAGFPHVRFGGAYNGEKDLADLYGDVHFAWCVDHFEEGANSAWLLPNRVYESTFHGAVPLALDSVETGAFLRRNGFGITLGSSAPEELVRLLRTMTPERYNAARERMRALPANLVSTSRDECVALVRALSDRQVL